MRTFVRCLVLVSVFSLFAASCMLQEEEQIAQVSQPSVFAPCPESLSCNDPLAAQAACEARWGPSSGKVYHVPCACGVDPFCTNSDCFSNCIYNYCRCGRDSGSYDWGCVGVPPVPQEPDAKTCQCHRMGVTDIHNYWCCGDGDQNPSEDDDICGTIDGWMCGNVCPGVTPPQQPDTECTGLVCLVPVKVPCCASDAAACPDEDSSSQQNNLAGDEALLELPPSVCTHEVDDVLPAGGAVIDQ